MHRSRLLRALLAVSGLVAIGVGGTILLAPAAFHATNGIDLGENVSLRSEVRAPGGALLAAGGVILFGAFLPGLTFSSAVVAVVLYLSYGGARLLSMALDGMPAPGLVAAAGLELLLGLACAGALRRAT